MEINDALIDKLAVLARLQFEGEEKQKIKADFAAMLGFVDKLNELDTTGVDPLIYINEGTYMTLRPDVNEVSITKEEALKNAPKRDSDYFKVPRVISKS
jgi:aspartyl-tRNA(Asn)/glutamyl-tRNA(Gln) amidotransferase subunit C